MSKILTRQDVESELWAIARATPTYGAVSLLRPDHVAAALLASAECQMCNRNSPDKTRPYLATCGDCLNTGLNQAAMTRGLAALKDEP